MTKLAGHIAHFIGGYAEEAPPPLQTREQGFRAPRGGIRAQGFFLDNGWRFDVQWGDQSLWARRPAPRYWRGGRDDVDGEVGAAPKTWGERI